MIEVISFLIIYNNYIIIVKTIPIFVPFWSTKYASTEKSIIVDNLR